MAVNLTGPICFATPENLKVDVPFKKVRAVIKIADSYYDDNCALQKVLFDSTVERDLERAKTLSIQGPFLDLKDIQLKASHSILYNWKINDHLVVFAIKARLNLHSTNYVIHLWNREHDPLCTFCRQHTESMAHLTNGCRELS